MRVLDGLGPSFGNRLAPFGTMGVWDPQFGTMRVWDHAIVWDLGTVWGRAFGTMGVRDQLFGTIPFGTIVPGFVSFPQFGTMRVWDHGWGHRWVLGPPFGTMRVFRRTSCLGPRVFGTSWTMEPAVWDLGPGVWDHEQFGFGTTVVWDHGCPGPP